MYVTTGGVLLLDDICISDVLHMGVQVAVDML